MNRARWLVLFALAACMSGPRSHPLAAGVTFDGRWDSNFHEMRLHQRGRHVSGTVGYKDGAISGELDGDVLHFIWNQKENRQHGKGWLQISSDGQKLEGRWGYADSDEDGGRWWAERYEGGPTEEVGEPQTQPQ